ncbi:LysR substrate-binding domain-containing protein, partial [Rhizobium leguminosarum]|uniref:LysR substrate-binding domain-containing protein n=1 Tax=Rhizobium leguminosarum TaxID=384 RepID=UPI003F98F569
STIAPIAAAFIRKYPTCRVELLLADTKMDLLANQIDLSIRVGWLDDSSHQARRIGSFRQAGSSPATILSVGQPLYALQPENPAGRICLPPQAWP